MFLSQHNKLCLRRRFPRVELSYENNAYKKVHSADLYLALSSKKNISHGLRIITVRMFVLS